MEKPGVTKHANHKNPSHDVVSGRQGHPHVEEGAQSQKKIGNWCEKRWDNWELIHVRTNIECKYGTVLDNCNSQLCSYMPLS